MSTARLQQQIQFILEVDRLKQILRRTLVATGERRENSAEHSWHVTLMAWVLQEHANDSSLDMFKVMKMLMIHDIVEIDAGDTFIYDEAAMTHKQQREIAAAERLFNLLPSEQKTEFRQLWDEYEAGETPEAQFADAIDRLQPLLINSVTQGHSWQQHNIKLNAVQKKVECMTTGSTTLKQYAMELIEKAADMGILTR